MNYLICAPGGFAIVGGSLASLAVRGERFWASARQRPRTPDSSERLPLCFIFRVPLCRDTGVFLWRAMGFKVGAPCFSGGSWKFSPAKKQAS
jgi:hypothetical protein